MCEQSLTQARHGLHFDGLSETGLSDGDDLFVILIQQKGGKLMAIDSNDIQVIVFSIYSLSTIIFTWSV